MTPCRPLARLALALLILGACGLGLAGVPAQAICKEVGAEWLVIPLTGGGADAAHAALSGEPVIEGPGLPGFGDHSPQAEFVAIDALPHRLYLAVRMMMDLAQGR
jgi:glutamate carboxypeptidase